MRNRRLPVLLSATLLGLPAVAAPAPDRALSLRVRDVATGRALPAMASVRGPGSTAGKIPVPASGLSRLGIPPGDVTLLVQAAGHASLQTHFDVDAGPSLPVTIWLHALDDASTAPVPEAGTGIVTGFLYDARSGQPLEGAEVSCSLGGGAVSDASGSFLLSYPSPATADRPILGAILVTHRGHESLELRGLVLQGGGVKIVEDLAPGSGVRVKDVTPMPLRSREEQEVHQSAPHATEPAAPIAGRRARPFLQTRPVPDSVDAVDLVGIAPPSVIRVGTGCSCTSCSGVSVLSLEDYVAGGLDNEWISSWAAHSLRAGSIPYRSYGAWYVYNPINGNYDICSNACCQAYDPATYGNTQSAANLTAGIMLELGGSLMRSEYSAENNSWDDPNDGLSCVNSDQSCGDGWAGSPATGWPCLSDAPCTGWGCFGHGRGECQWGTSRWANQGQLWSWIGDHYYNDNGGGSGSRTAHMTSPIFMPAFSPNPSTVIPGQTFSIDVTADNTAALGHTEIMIGASLYSVITGYVSDPANDTKVTLAVGTNSVSRPFTVPMGTPTGVYDLIVALWYDVDGDGTITGSDLSLVLATAPGAVTVADACGLMVLSPSSLPGGTIGTPYSQTITASGGQPPYTFAVTAGSLPPGLGLAGSGVLSGAPTAAGSFPFTASAVDALGCTASQGYTIAVGTPSSADNVLVGEGLGQPNPNRVRVMLASGTGTNVNFLAYAAGAWGVNVAAGDIDGGATQEILTGPGPGTTLGPQVRAFDRTGAAIAKVNFYAYGTLKYGVNAGAGKLDADAFAEILSGAGPGAAFGPHVRGWNYDGSSLSAMAKVSFFAYGTLKFGVNVASGSVDADGYAELLTGPGPGAIFGPQVRGFDYDGANVSSIAKINFNAYTTLQYGANVAGGSVDGDAYSEIVTAPGPGAGGAFRAHFKGFNYDGAAIAALPGFDTTVGATSYGGRAGVGDVSGDGEGDLLGGLGRDPAANATVSPFTYDGSALSAMPSFNPFPAAKYGVNVSGAALGY